MADITQWIAAAREGDRGALDKLFGVLYGDLRRIAHARLAHNVRNTLLDTTALVHECYARFVAQQRLNVDDRAHFLAYSARVMRSIIVDMARAGLAERRGGGVEHVPLDTASGAQARLPEEEIFDVDAALAELARLDPRLASVVEMRYFGGMSDVEIGDALGLTDRTVRRDWEKARALLSMTLRG